MSLADLKATLEGASKGGTLPLTRTLIGSDAVGDVIAIAWPDDKTMTIAGAKLALSGDGQRLALGGTVSLAEVRAARVDAVFTESAGAVHMLATLTLPAKLKLTQLFAVLASDALKAPVIAGGKIILNTENYHDAGAARDLRPGMNLSGKIKPVAAYRFLGVLLDADTELAIAGPITDFALPLFAFKTASTRAALLDVPLPGLSLELSMIDNAKPGQTPIAGALTMLRAYLEVGGVTGTLTADLPAEASSLSLLAEFDNLTLTSCAPLATYIGRGVDPFKALPGPLKDEIGKVTDAFALRAMALHVAIAKPAFIAVDLQVRVDLKGFKIFSLIPDLAITEVDLSLKVNNAPGAAVLAYGATASIEIGGRYPVVLGLQTQSASGYLLNVAPAPGAVLKLVDVLETFVPGLSGFPNFDVDTFGLVIVPELKQFAFDAVIRSDWTIIDTPRLIMTEIDVAASYDAALTPPASGAIKGLCTLQVDTDANNDIPITLTAVKDKGGDNWRLSGHSCAEQIIPIGNLLGAIVRQFDTTASAPMFLDGLAVDNLDLSFNTRDRAFHFGAEVLMPFTEDIRLTLTVLLDVTPIGKDRRATATGTRYETRFTGTMQIAKYQFDIVFDTGSQAHTTLIALYRPVEGKRARIALKELLTGISPELARDVPLDIEIDLQDVKFVVLKDPATNNLIFDLDVGVPIDLSHIPIVGDKLPADCALGITRLQGAYATRPLDEKAAGGVNALLPSGVEPLPPQGLIQGVNLSAEVQVATWKAPVVLAGARARVSRPSPAEIQAHIQAHTQENTAPGAGASVPALSAAGRDDEYQWINVNKQVGIFQFGKLGMGYAGNRLSLALDAAVALGPLAFSMEGLAVGTPMNEFAPAFDLNGLGLAFEKPPLSISGNFIKVCDPPPTSYYGQVVVQAARMGFSALGGWAPGANPASFFLYANIQAPLGGPPFLYVTGLAGGLGINRTLRLPSMDTLSDYVLLPGNAPAPENSPSATIARVLPQLQTCLVNQPGEYWIAAGIEFSSFEMVKGRVLASVSFGVDFQLGVLGSCSMSLPSGTGKPLAYLQIDILASFTPSTGLLAVKGRVSRQSYVFGGFVRIEGGFAFSLWFAGPQPGDFVVSVGGYAPGYDKPGHYPRVPRMRMLFSLGPLSVTGRAYFALTPSMLMAGMTLNAVFDAGPIRAWLDAGIDVLIAWAPFHYEACVYVSIGVSLDLGLFTSNLHVGANFFIWGPAFGGRAEVDLDCVSFAIAFGAAQEPPPPIGWRRFKSNFLPADSARAAPALKARPPAAAAAADKTKQNAHTAGNIIAVKILEGLVSTAAPGYEGIVTPNGFEIDIATAIPANAAQWIAGADTAWPVHNSVADWRTSAATPGRPFLRLSPGQETFSATQVWNPRIDIGPMGKRDIASLLTVSLRKHTDTDAQGAFSDAITDLTIKPSLMPSNTALWKDQQVKTDPNLPRFLPATLLGLVLSAAPRQPDKVSAVALIDLLFAGGHTCEFSAIARSPLPGYTLTTVQHPENVLSIRISGQHELALRDTDKHLQALAQPWVAGRRRALAEALRDAGFNTFAAADMDLTRMAKDKALSDWPMVRQLGA